MADRLLSDSFEISGEWFLPEAEERKIPGTLKFVGERTELELFEPLSVRDEGIVADTGSKNYPVIYGITLESEAITILKARSAGTAFRMNSGGIRQPERIVSHWLLVGGFLTADFLYHELSFRIPGLHIWLSEKLVQESHDREGANGPIVLTYKVGGGAVYKTSIPEQLDIEWFYQRRSNTDLFTSVEVTISGWIKICPNSPQKLTWYLEELSKITTMLAFISGSSMSPDCIKGLIEEHHQAIYALVSLANRKSCTYNSDLNFFMLRDSMGVGLSDVVARWFEVYPRVQKPSELALGVLSSEKLWLHVEFLSLMQALEGFHRGLYEGLYMDESSYSPIKQILSDAIPKAVSPDHKESLKSRIQYGNEISLRKRLDHLAASLPEQIRKIVLGHDGQVPRTWIDTRNYYTHWNEESRENVLDFQGIYEANVRIRHFIRMLYLNLMGIPEEAIVKSFDNHSDGSRHLSQLNEKEQSSP